jgi:hypothetical protein
VTKPKADLAASLDEFAAEVKAQHTTAYWFTLPEDVRQVITDSPHATHTIVKWLQANGYPEATYSKIEHYRRTSQG